MHKQLIEFACSQTHACVCSLLLCGMQHGQYDLPPFLMQAIKPPGLPPPASLLGTIYEPGAWVKAVIESAPTQSVPGRTTGPSAAAAAPMQLPAPVLLEKPAQRHTVGLP